METRGAIFAGKTRLPRHAILGIGVREPGDALLAHRTRHHLPVPVDQKLGFIEPRARPGLPTGVVSHGADKRDAIRALAVHQDLGAVTQKSPCKGKRVIMGEESALKLSQRGLDARQGGAHENPEAIIRPRTYDLST